MLSAIVAILLASHQTLGDQVITVELSKALNPYCKPLLKTMSILAEADWAPLQLSQAATVGPMVITRIMMDTQILVLP